MVVFTLQIHPSIREPDVPSKIKVDVEQMTILTAIDVALQKYPKLSTLILDNGKMRAGLLVFADKTELTSMGLLDSEINESLNIRIVPILHGG